MDADHGTDFFEEDEPLEKIEMIWESGVKGLTAPQLRIEDSRIEPSVEAVGVWGGLHGDPTVSDSRINTELATAVR